MKRLLALAIVAGGLAVTVPANAAPYCGPYGGVRCTPDGARFCQVWIRETRTCVAL